MARSLESWFWGSFQEPRIQYFVLDNEHKSAQHLFEQKYKYPCIDVIITSSSTHDIHHNAPQFYRFMFNAMVDLVLLLQSLFLLCYYLWCRHTPSMWCSVWSRRGVIGLLPAKAGGYFLTAFKTTLWIATLKFKGCLCLPLEDFSASSETKHDRSEYNTTGISLYRGPIKFVLRFKHPHWNVVKLTLIVLQPVSGTRTILKGTIALEWHWNKAILYN